MSRRTVWNVGATGPEKSSVQPPLRERNNTGKEPYLALKAAFQAPLACLMHRSRGLASGHPGSKPASDRRGDATSGI